MRRVTLFAVVLALSATFVSLGPAVPASAVPAGFTDVLVADIAQPTAIAALPDGRRLVTQKTGQVRLLGADGVVAPAPVQTIANVCSAGEQGLLGVAVDQQFATNGYVFVYVTINVAGVGCTNLVLRYTMTSTNTFTNVTTLVTTPQTPATNHNGGDVKIGKDGNLYVSVGDGGTDAGTARDRSNLLGNILRITRDGAIPAGNPYTGAGTARCNTTGATTSGTLCQEIYAYGLRNPYRIAPDINASGTKFFVNDVGQGDWEEIDLLAAGADFGWNVREGHCAAGSTTNCGPQPAGMTNPVFDYPSTDCASITGGAFVPSTWPNYSGGSYLYSDFVCSKLFQLTPNGSGGYDQSEFALTAAPVHLEMLPEGDDYALYYLTFGGSEGGQIRKVEPVRIAPAVSPGRLVPIVPTRVLDTRSGLGVSAAGLTTANTTTTLTLPVATVPSNAIAVALNVTQTEPTGPGFVTVFPGYTSRPGTSNLNSTFRGETVANAAITKLGTGRSVALYTQVSSHLVIDVTGYWLPAATSSAGRFVAATDPHRLLDTRSGVGAPASRPGAGGQVDLQVNGVGPVPATGVQAVAVVVTVTEPTLPGFVTVWPTGTVRPVASTVNPVAAGESRSNLAIVPVGTNGKISLFTLNPTHLVVDVAGYFTDATAPNTSAGLFQVVNTGRFFDSRLAANAPKLVGGQSRQISLPSVPSTATAVVYNLTATETAGGGFFTAYALNRTLPLASNVNFEGTNRNRAALAITPTPPAAKAVNVFTNTGAHAIVDVVGWFDVAVAT